MDSAFFQRPNHKKQSFSPSRRAEVMRVSSREKSYLPSSGSISSQYRGTMTAFMFKPRRAGQSFSSKKAGSEALELWISPLRMKKGLSWT